MDQYRFLAQVHRQKLVAGGTSLLMQLPWRGNNNTGVKYPDTVDADSDGYIMQNTYPAPSSCNELQPSADDDIDFIDSDV